MKKYIVNITFTTLILFLGCLGIFVKNAEAATTKLKYGEKNYKNDNEELAKDVMESSKYYDLEGLENYILEEESFSELNIKEIINNLAEGNVMFTINALCKHIYISFFGNIENVLKLLRKLIIIIVFSAILANLSDGANNSQVKNAGFTITYMIVISILMLAFVEIIDFTYDTLLRIINFNKVLLPVYAVSIGVSNGVISSKGYYQMIMVLIFIVNVICIKFILPLIKMYVLLVVMSNIFEKNYMTKAGELIYRICNYTVRMLLVFITGINIIRKMFVPIADANNTFTKNLIQMFIGVSRTGKNMSDLIYGSGNIVKNTVGGIGITVLAVILIYPVIRIVCYIFMFELTEVIIEPISDIRIQNCINGIIKGLEMQMKVIVMCGIMFGVTIALVCMEM